jgi:preprotein translocase subunit SecG
VDWIAGAVVGVLVLSLRGWLAGLYSLPADLLLVMGIVNLAYACVSFTLAMLSRGDSVPLLRMVAVANVIWAVICVVLAVVWFGKGSVFGVASLFGEGLFVGGLGVLEWLTAGRRGGGHAAPGTSERVGE